MVSGPSKSPHGSSPDQKYHDNSASYNNLSNSVKTSDIVDPLSDSLDAYRFPHGKIRRTLKDSSRTPLVLIACGSFSPPTFLHLRMFEIAADYARDNTDFEVVGGYLSPVNAQYRKDGLESSIARVEMCSLACLGHDWLSVDDWETLNPAYVPTAKVLDHFDKELRGIGDVTTESGESKSIRIALLAGADLISTFATPGVWDQKDLEHILGNYGCFILERMGANIDASLESLGQWMSNIWFINQPITNDVSCLLRFHAASIRVGKPQLTGGLGLEYEDSFIPQEGLEHSL